MKTKSQDPIDIARNWMMKQFEDIYGPMRKWDGRIMDIYHARLGLIVDFVTDCWPKED